MTEGIHPPSILRMIRMDTLAQLPVLLLIIFLPSIAWVGASNAQVYPKIWGDLFPFAAILIVICVPFLIWRILHIRALFSRAIEIKGRVKTIFTGPPYSKYGQKALVYTYEYDGQRFNRSYNVPARWFNRLKPGDELALIIDPADPKRVFIRDLFI